MTTTFNNLTLVVEHTVEEKTVMLPGLMMSTVTMMVQDCV